MTKAELLKQMASIQRVIEDLKRVVIEIDSSDFINIKLDGSIKSNDYYNPDIVNFGLKLNKEESKEVVLTLIKQKKESYDDLFGKLLDWDNVDTDVPF